MAKVLYFSRLLFGILLCPTLGLAQDASKAFSNSALSDSDYLGAFGKSLFVLGVFWLLSHVVLRRQRDTRRPSARLKLIESLSLEKGQRLVLVTIDQSELLIACSSSGICSLGQLPSTHVRSQSSIRAPQNLEEAQRAPSESGGEPRMVLC